MLAVCTFCTKSAPNLQIPYKSLCTQTCLPIFLAEHFLGYKNFGPLRTPFPYQIQSVSNIRILEYMCHKYLFRHLFVSTSSFAPFRCSGRVTHALVIRQCFRLQILCQPLDSVLAVGQCVSRWIIRLCISCCEDLKELGYFVEGDNALVMMKVL